MVVTFPAAGYAAIEATGMDLSVEGPLSPIAEEASDVALLGGSDGTPAAQPVGDEDAVKASVMGGLQRAE